MRRFQLVEVEDLPWFPSLLRDAGTGYLRWAAEVSGQSRRLAPHLERALDASGATRIVDLCSGGGGPLPAIVAALARGGRRLPVVLTDLYPNRGMLERVAARAGGHIEVYPEPVDASAVPDSLTGLRTLFNAFHHFPPARARAILQSAVDADQPIAVVEVMRRSFAPIVAMCFVPLFVLCALPFLRPFRWAWLPLTYLVPVIPLFVFWDGLVSCLRVYTPDEMREMIDGVAGSERYDWQICEPRLLPAPARATLLIGVPRHRRTGDVAAGGAGAEADR